MMQKNFLAYFITRPSCFPLQDWRMNFLKIFVSVVNGYNSSGTVGRGVGDQRYVNVDWS